MTTSSLALSVDLEWFTHTPAYRSARGSVAREDVGAEGLEYLLDLFERLDATATFFVVGEIAETHPGLVERVAADGHEVASHTQTHRLLTDLDPDERRRELVESRRTLAAVTGREVEGFRAPAFARPEDLFDALVDAGYGYDSSVAPARSIPGWYGGEYAVDRPVPASVLDDRFPEGVVEVPVSVYPRLRLPISGAWVRLLGRWYCESGIRRLQAQGVTPVLYVHPWEFVDLPDVAGVPWRVYRRTGDWLRRTVESLLEGAEATTVGDLAERVSPR